MAYEYSLQTVSPLFGWDFHTFEVFNANMPLATESPFLSVSESSTGYLQDAIAEWGNRCKRQRVTTTESDNLVQNYWNWNFNEDPFANDGCWSENTTIFSGDPLSSSTTGISNGATLSMEAKSQEATSENENENERLSPSPSSYKDSVTNHDPDGKETSVSRDPLSSGQKASRLLGIDDPSSSNPYPKTMSEKQSGKRKIMARKRVAYPFAVVKPGGAEGDVTLDDINERILMRPTRPVRHPVGEFASHPCVSADGHGLSGKAVVALTRIHTQGRGTVTIIRTRG